MSRQGARIVISGFWPIRPPPSPPPSTRMAIHWAARRLEPRLVRWIGILFAIGSTCFFIGPFPGFVRLVGAEADGIVFLVGSLFFTSAALLQALQSAGPDRLPTLISSPARSSSTSAPTGRCSRRSTTPRSTGSIWAPEAAGSACFLVSGAIAYSSVRKLGDDHRDAEWRIAAVNLAGCILFGISTIASYVVPSSGDVLDLAAANFTTAAGGLCFLIGSLMLIRHPGESSTAPAAA